MIKEELCNQKVDAVPLNTFWAAHVSKTAALINVPVLEHEMSNIFVLHFCTCVHTIQRLNQLLMAHEVIPYRFFLVSARRLNR